MGRLTKVRPQLEPILSLFQRKVSEFDISKRFGFLKKGAGSNPADVVGSNPTRPLGEVMSVKAEVDILHAEAEREGAIERARKKKETEEWFKLQAATPFEKPTPRPPPLTEKARLEQEKLDRKIAKLYQRAAAKEEEPIDIEFA